MREDHGDVGEVQGGRCDAEDCGGGLCGADGDGVEGYAEEDDEPDGVEGGVGFWVDFGKVPVWLLVFVCVFFFLFFECFGLGRGGEGVRRKRQCVVTSKGIRHSRIS